jgi:hypothetical protein
MPAKQAPTRMAVSQNDDRQPYAATTDSPTMGPIVGAAAPPRPYITKRGTPSRSPGICHRSFRTPAKTLTDGEPTRPDNARQTAIVRKFAADAPTMVKIKCSSNDVLYTYCLPNSSESAEVHIGPTTNPRAYSVTGRIAKVFPISNSAIMPGILAI